MRLDRRRVRVGLSPELGRHGRSPRASACSANARSVVIRNQASQTLSPRPSTPTRFMPSFQSPMPISGRPCAPVVHARPQRAEAVLVDAAVLVGDLRQVVDLVLVRLERPHA